MDHEILKVLFNAIFVRIILLYEGNKLHVNQGALLARLNAVFWATHMLNRPSDSVPIYERIQHALKMVFWVNSDLESLDKTVVKRALPGWREKFAEVFDEGISHHLPVHAPKKFHIWNFLTPTMTVPRFLEFINNHIDAFRHLHDLERILIYHSYRSIVPKRHGQANADPAKSSNDPNFFHLCKFCSDLNENDRADAPKDHLQRCHNYFSSAAIRDIRARDLGYQKRRNPDVLKALIKKERAIFNSQAMRLYEASKAAAVLGGGNDPANPPVLDVQGADLVGLNQEKLAMKLCEERTQLDFRRHGYLEATIRQENERAWEVGRKNHLAFQDFAWGN